MENDGKPILASSHVMAGRHSTTMIGYSHPYNRASTIRTSLIGEKATKMTYGQTLFMILSMYIGGTMMQMGWAFARSGWSMLFFLALVLMPLLTLTGVMLVRTSSEVALRIDEPDSCPSYPATAEYAFGPAGKWAVIVVEVIEFVMILLLVQQILWESAGFIVNAWAFPFQPINTAGVFFDHVNASAINATTAINATAVLNQQHRPILNQTVFILDKDTSWTINNPDSFSGTHATLFQGLMGIGCSILVFPAILLNDPAALSDFGKYGIVAMVVLLAIGIDACIKFDSIYRV